MSPDPETALGLMRGTVALAEWHPGWGTAYREIADAVRAALTGSIIAVEHVGSTAVPGLLAKPIIDVAVLLASGAALDEVTIRLEQVGFVVRGDRAQQGGVLFVRGGRPDHRSAHVHVLVDGDPRWHRYLAFRDRLRSDSQVRDAYVQLKTRLARAFPDDRVAYTAAKHDFIRRVLAP